MTDARTPPARQFPVVTVIAMAAAVVAPAVMVLVNVIDGGQGSVVILLIPPVLGVVGAVAAFSRNLEVGLRWVWALLSVALGFTVPPLLWMLIVLLFGP